MKIISNSAFLYPVQPLTHFLLFFSRSLSTEAYGKLKDVDKEGVVHFNPMIYDHLIRALLAQGSIEEALDVKDM